MESFLQHYFPGADSSRAVVNYYWQKDVHLALVNAYINAFHEWLLRYELLKRLQIKL